MANNEASFQTELLDEMRKAGWHALKVAKLSFAGVPDLYVKSPSHAPVWIELKFEKFRPSHSTIGVPLNLSPLQRQFLRKEQEVFGYAGWALCVGHHRAWDLYAGHHSTDSWISNTHHIQRRQVGEKWDITSILGAIIG